ncbi:OmpA family protein [Pseudomonas sp. Bout1]|uniref:OmpA family protein n=1 Tax=Pseudomonas sp. Bout1 TaxID=3048600 RepID=UPI002AB41005|nr:OmpA family protein [Pseudomonas sp. Bout1]MDY7536387.1 OmpA family protein [Pseudomonas sp. Bout1]MEB0183450.1 OmpA family protein [Pseudomonas sp. Bout1]
MFKHTTIFHVALLSVALCSAPSVMAEGASPKAFGSQYTPVAPVSSGQAQVVYYRAPAANVQAGAAHVYVDREFQSALLPGGYSAFCVTPGQHTLGAYLNDAPQYKGKSTDVYSAQLTGGMTYFLKVSEGANTSPQAVPRAQAEIELAATHQQVHALSRASHVVACDYQRMPAAASYKDYSLSGDVLFAFGKSGYADISVSGRKAIRDLIGQLRSEHATLEQIEVIGHTDAIGKPAANHALGLKRAQTVRRVLLDGGLAATHIDASSAGSSEPVSSDCQGSRAEQVACYAPDRRVVVRVDLLP